MTNQAPVTLDDLKRAIDKVERYKQAPLNEALHNAVGWCAAERDAWKAAFEWLNCWHAEMDKGEFVGHDMATLIAEEYHDGMRLIREKLR